MDKDKLGKWICGYLKGFSDPQHLPYIPERPAYYLAGELARLVEYFLDHPDAEYDDERLWLFIHEAEDFLD